MALQSLKSQLKQLVQSMYDEGLLDRQFEAVQSLQNADNPQIVVELITIFCDESPKVLSELTNNLNGYVVDYTKMSDYVHHLKGSSCSIGARQLTLAVLDLHQSCKGNNKEGTGLRRGFFARGMSMMDYTILAIHHLLSLLTMLCIEDSVKITLGNSLQSRTIERTVTHLSSVLDNSVETFGVINSLKTQDLSRLLELPDRVGDKFDRHYKLTLQL